MKKLSHLFGKSILAAGFLAISGLSNAALVYVNDEQGRTASWDSVSSAVNYVGSVADSFNVSQIIGSAWDSVGNQLVLLDRSSQSVYGMDVTTGASSLLFTVGSTFQGGAVKDGVLYGINEGSQLMEAYDMTTGLGIALGAPESVSHTHGLGIDSLNGELFLKQNDSVFAMNTDGSKGNLLVNSSGSFWEDADGLDGNFLSVAYSSDLFSTDGTTGVESIVAGGATFSSLGLNNLSGVSVVHDGNQIPEPATLLMLSVGLLGLAGRRRNR